MFSLAVSKSAIQVKLSVHALPMGDEERSMALAGSWPLWWSSTLGTKAHADESVCGNYGSVVCTSAEPVTDLCFKIELLWLGLDFSPHEFSLRHQ